MPFFVTVIKIKRRRILEGIRLYINRCLTYPREEVANDDPVATMGINYQLNPTNISIHQCVRTAIGNLWNSPPYHVLFNAIQNHMETSPEVQSTLRQNSGLTEDEIGALIYYTSDVRNYNGTVDECIFTLINRDLRSRNPNDLNKWLPFLYYMHQAKKHLPSYNGRVYRGIRDPLTKLSKQYTQGGCVVWIAFTSTTKDDLVIKQFSKNGTGTWMIIDVNDGIEIPFSLFPTENEVLLYPNAAVQVDTILDPEMKTLLKLPMELDIIRFTQR